MLLGRTTSKSFARYTLFTRISHFDRIQNFTQGHHHHHHHHHHRQRRRCRRRRHDHHHHWNKPGQSSSPITDAGLEVRVGVGLALGLFFFPSLDRNTPEQKDTHIKYITQGSHQNSILKKISQLASQPPRL